MKKPNTYTLRILGSAPNRLPMDRLALYLSQMAKLMGESSKVHFYGVVKGSAALKAWVETDAANKVSKRISRAVTQNNLADKDALKALENINKLLIEDKTRGELKDPSGAVIYPFSGGNKQDKPRELVIEEECSVSGQVIKIGGRDETIPLLLRNTDGTEYRCTVRGEQLAREISANYLGDPIEVSGKGKWRRTEDGKWTLENLNVTSWTSLSTDWDSAYELMKKLAGTWSDVPDIEKRCLDIRKGF